MYIVLDTCDPVITLQEIQDEVSPSSSPLRPMSPETQQLFNILAEYEPINNINENNDISKHVDAPDCFDSDDSVRDPDYVSHSKVIHIDESTTSCSSFSDSVDHEVSKNKKFPSKEKLNNEGIEMLEPNNEESTELIPPISDEDLRSNLGTGRPKRGRKRINPQLRSERKHNKYNNLEYTTSKNKLVKPKTFIEYNCKCLKNCASLIPIEKRKEEFEKFVRLGSYNAQCLYLGSCIKEENKKRSYTMTNVPEAKKKPKQFSRVYSINGTKVCRDMFLNTFQITTQKVTIALKKLRSSEPIMDGRGVSTGGKNKLSDEMYNFIVETISKLPKYESHYRREKNNDTLYLQPGMTLTKIYDIYQQEYTKTYGEGQKCASFESVKKIFYTKFNLKCKSLKKDTCNKCDMLAVKIQNARTLEEKEQARTEKTRHLEKAENLRKQMNSDFEDARNMSTIECLTFDLEKTLPLPRIPTNVAFYKRQLWLYNSGIHSASNDIGHCYIWVEGEAGRGAQEVGSCLIKYIQTKLRPTVEHLILWSDCCGGQNRNIKIVLMLKALLNSHDTLKVITMRFLESGHTFLPNDTDFSKIETALKHYQRIYTAEEYISIIKKCKKRKPLQVYKMNKADFYSTEKLEKNTTNRKKFTDKTKVNWIKTKEIRIEKEKVFSIFMKPSLEEDYKELTIEKKVKGETRNINMSDFCLLWPDGKAIAPAKLADLQSMYQYIPEDCHKFYKNLKSMEGMIDDVDGFGGEPDFEMQEDDEYDV